MATAGPRAASSAAHAGRRHQRGVKMMSGPLRAPSAREGGRCEYRHGMATTRGAFPATAGAIVKENRKYVNICLVFYFAYYAGAMQAGESLDGEFTRVETG